MGPPGRKCEISLKAGNMCMNRFCIDEDASFELSWVYDFKEQSNKVTDKIRKATLERTATGKVNYC